MRRTLSNRAFRLLFTAQGLSLLGDAVFTVAIAFAVLDVTDSAGALGTVLAIGSAVLVATMLVSGVWADRLPRLRIMIASDLVRAGSQATLAVLLVTHNATLTSIALLNAVYMSATAFFQPAFTGVIPQILPAEHLVAGNGLLVSTRSVTAIAGAGLGGVLVAWLGSGYAIAADACAAGASAIVLLRIGAIAAARRDPEQSDDGVRLSFVAELRDGWSEVRSRRWLWMSIAGGAAFLLLYEGPFQVVGPLVMRAHYGGSISWGLVVASLSAGSVLGAVISSWRRLRRPMLTSLSIWFTTALIPLLMIARVPLSVLMVVMFVVGISWGLWNAIWHAVLQHDIPGDRLARVSAWDWMGSLTGLPIGYAIGGALTGAVGTTTTLIGMAVGVTAVNAMFISSRVLRSLGDDLPRG